MSLHKFLRVSLVLSAAAALCSCTALATVLATIRGIVHDPEHRPIAGAQVVLQAANSAFSESVKSSPDGSFSFTAAPLGDYVITASASGFDTLKQSVTVRSNTSPVFHLELQISSAHESVVVTAENSGTNMNSVTPTTLISRDQIARTPGASRTNGLQMITDYVPGAYVSHDMLHIRGGHQVSWLIDGIEIPNTNIANNVGPQIDPKDIDYLEVQRGSYAAGVGDRTYAAFNVEPRTGFERNHEAEVLLSAGNFLQSNNQISLGSHTEKFAYYLSLNANRSDYGLSTPIPQVLHDAENGYGGFSSLIYNRTPRDQFRLVTQLRADYYQIPYDPNPDDPENQVYDSSGLRDGQHETDGLAAFSWIHTFSPSALLQVSPFYHYNRADYESSPFDRPFATTSDRASNYAGMQASITGQVAGHTLEGGFYSFGQQDHAYLGSLGGAGAAGGVIEEYVSDNYRVTPWLTLIGGLRQSHFTGSFAEDATDPRAGIAVRIPKLDWVFRGFYGRFYQPPPLLTISGPILSFANRENTAFRTLHGERDEEHQFGVEIPFRGWLLDADTFRTRAKNFLDHSNIGESSIYYPVTIDGALIRAWELTLHSPRISRYGRLHLAYSNQIAEQRGAITGGLICFPVTSAQCDVEPGYTPVDHDQRNTLNVGFDATLPWRVFAATNVYYGSGFSNGDPNAQYPGEYLPQHTTFDLSVGKTFHEKTVVSITALNVANRRVLLDNSLTFGGFHYDDPRQIYGQIRFYFHY